MKQAEKIVSRYIKANESFQTPNDLEVFLRKEGKTLGWMPSYKDKDRTTFVKKFYGFLMQVYWSARTYTLTDITISPVTYPRTDRFEKVEDRDAWKEAYDKTKVPHI